MSNFGRRSAGIPLTDEQRQELRALSHMPDSEIDFSDIPERVDADCKETATLEEHIVTLRLDAEVADWLRTASVREPASINRLLKRAAHRAKRADSTLQLAS